MNKLLTLFLLMILPVIGMGQHRKAIHLPMENVSNASLTVTGSPRINASHFQLFRIDISQLLNELQGITYREGEASGFTGEVLLPHPDGTQHLYSVKRNQTLDPALNAQFPEIMTLDAYATDGSGAFGKWDITPQGLHAMIMIPGQSTIFIDPYLEGNNEYYIVYHKKDFLTDKVFSCSVTGAELESKNENNTIKAQFGTCELRTYRLALAATVEYCTFHGGTLALAQAAQATSMNRVNGVYEKDIAITMVIIPNNSQIIYPSNPDPYTNGTPGTMINQNQTNVDNVIGSANYDIGHVFGTNSGGLAGLGVVCTGGQKARGVTGSSAPVGDPFDIDYVAHEMGHQFGGNHTQNNNCNSVVAARREPGSASTIMGYAGICAPNVQSNSDDYFHGYNLQEIHLEITSTGHQCEQITPLSNTPPVISATNGNIVVPANTPFALTATATDADGDVLTYLWEQMDNEATTQPPLATATGGPNFRSFDPSLSPTRYFPNLQALANNGPFTWEVIPSVTRTMDFRVVVKDNHAMGSCNDYADVTVTTSSTAGPFVVTYPTATGITWGSSSSQTVTWNVANTDIAPINCTQVRILLSIDGGTSYPYTLSATTANDGSELIQVPAVSSTTCRIMVISSNGTFFDISDNNFTITCLTPETPAFTINTNYCVGASADLLPLQSDNSISGTWDAAITTASSGTTTYTFTPDAGQCAASSTLNVTVVDPVTPTFNTFGPYCLNEPVNPLPSTSLNGIDGNWSTNLSTSTAGISTYTFSPNTGSCATSASVDVEVTALPDNQVMQTGNTLNATQNGATYQWVDCNNSFSALSGETNQSFTPVAITGSYAVIVTLNGCSDTSACFVIDQSGIFENEMNLQVSPNPFEQEINFFGSGLEIEKVELLDAAGKLIQSQEMNGKNEGTLHTPRLSNGFYVLRITSTTGIVSRSLIKK